MFEKDKTVITEGSVATAMYVEGCGVMSVSPCGCVDDDPDGRDDAAVYE